MVTDGSCGRSEFGQGERQIIRQGIERQQDIGTTRASGRMRRHFETGWGWEADMIDIYWRVSARANLSWERSERCDSRRQSKQRR